MSGAPEGCEGWTLAEALKLTADPDSWEAWIVAKDNLEKLAMSKVSPARSAGQPDHETRRKASTDAFDRLRDGLWRHLIDRRLDATGEIDDSKVATSLRSASWDDLTVEDWKEAVVLAKASNTRIYNVRIYPVLHSPDVLERLAGCSLRDVFRTFIIEDPEIAALGKRVMREHPVHACVFQDGQYPAGLDFKWPVDIVESEVVSNLAHPWFSPPSPKKPSATIVSAAHAIVSRCQALRKILIGGKLVLRGTFAATGVVGTVDPLQWTRANLSIEVRNGDLLEEEDGKRILRWSGLALINPGSTFHVNSPEPDGIRPGTAEPHGSAPKKSFARVERHQATVDACIDWLTHIMRASKNERTHSKQSLWNEAQQKWPGLLSHRSFLTAWTEAIHISDAKIWGAAGAPKKIKSLR